MSILCGFSNILHTILVHFLQAEGSSCSLGSSADHRPTFVMIQEIIVFLQNTLMHGGHYNTT